MPPLKDSPAAARETATSGWTGWRGPRRDGQVHWLPERLPEKPAVVWERTLRERGLGGLVANSQLVIVSDRELGDSFDAFYALDPQTGAEKWAVRYPVRGNLDYGNSPRATPLLTDTHAYLLGAFGQLSCVALDTGEIEWDLDLRDEYGATDRLVWGTCSSPLIVDGKLIVNPGAPQASLVALDPLTGEEIWKTPGDPAAFASLIVAEFHDRRQLIGYDKTSLGGWDVETGKRLWKLVPPHPNDFNVPTPLQVGDRLLVTTENNATRLYDIDNQGRILPEPVAINRDLAPDSHTPTVSGQRLFGVWGSLFCLDLQHGLKTLWSSDDDAFTTYASIVAHGDRVLITTAGGELILIDAGASEFKPVSRVKVFDDDSGVYSHPAFLGKRIYLRGSTQIRCLSLVD